jgi:hypothetical protein
MRGGQAAKVPLLGSRFSGASYTFFGVTSPVFARLQ